MIFPQKMHLVKIFVLKESLDELSKALYDFGFIEVEKASNFIQKEEGVSLLDTKDLIEKTDDLKKKIEKTLNLLKIKYQKPKSLPLRISLQVVDEIQKDFEGITLKVQELHCRIKENQTRIEKLETQSTVLSLIEEADLSLEHFRNLKNLVAKAGVIEQASLKNLKLYQSNDFLIEVKGRFLDNVFVFCLSLKEKEKELLNILRSVKFKEVSLDIASGKVGEAIESIEFEAWKLREEEAEFKLELENIKTKYGERLLEALYLLRENERLYKIMDNFLSSNAGYVVSGWVPKRELKNLKKELKELKGKVYIEEESAESLINKGFDFKNIPSYLGHKLFRPFEKLLKFYGVPAYRHIDPTIFMALSFITMFGMMFADLGHGLSLLGLGLALGVFKVFKDASWIFISSGLSSGFFGLLFGSVFGKEDILPALWFNPSNQPEKFLFIGIGFGVVMLTLGIILNIIQNAKNKDFKEVLFSQWGIFSLIFYWLSIYFIVAVLRYKALNISLGWLILIFLLPLIIITSGDILLSRKSSDLPEVIFKPVEIVLSLLTNTISFVRIAAFGLAHAALGSCVYLVASNLGSLSGIKESVVVEGNIGIIVLEGVIVFIQALRLEFYEFFSKFFQFQGREFKPLKERG